MGIPVVSTSHGFIGGGWRGRVYERIQRRAFRSFDSVVTVSYPMRDLLLDEGVSADRIQVLPNAWPEGDPPLPRAEARKLLGLPADGFQIGWVGRASNEKGPDVLVEALGRVDDLPWQASLIGGGPMLEPIRESLSRSTLVDRVRLHGGVPDAGRLLSAFDLFVLSSRTEGTPIALFEAMAAGCDIVATRVGGVPDVVSDAEALLVPSDDPDALGVALRAAMTDSGAAAARSAAATRRLENFRLDPWLDRYEELYRRLAPTPTPGLHI
jgi:glycosyltransferase involved in cell wall biosynthesis